MSEAFDELLRVIAALRDPLSGCPWDLKQTHRSLVPYLLEEAYEVVDAIEHGDPQQLREELGDLLLQVALHSQLAAEQNQFDLQQVAAGLSAKMIRRHPHVFGDARYASEQQQKRAWEDIKRSEKPTLVAALHASDLHGVPLALPALARAQKLQKKAAAVGFDWGEPEPVYAKIVEELDEVRAAVAEEEGAERIHEELGDLLFAVVNLVRHYGGNAEDALRRANTKFESRFREVERLAAKEQRALVDCSLQEMEIWWQLSKKV